MIKTLKSITLVVFVALSGNAGFAQSQKYQWKENTEGGYKYRYVTNDPTQSRFYTLKNGLTVMLSPSKKVPRIQTYVVTKAGSKTDPKDHTGLAHYLEHLLFKGTDKYGSRDWAQEKPLLDKISALYEKYNSTTDETQRKEIYKEIDQVSGEAAKFAIANEYDKMMSGMGADGTNAYTSFEQTVYVEDIPNNVVDKFLAVQGERFRNPVFRLFHTELEAVYEEKNIGLDNDGRKTMEAMFEAMFANNNYGKQTVIGTVEHLKNPSLKAIREYFDTYYVPNNMGVVMSGDFDPTEIVKKIDATFGYMQPKKVPPYTFAAEKPITQPIVREVKGPYAEFLWLGFRFPGAATKDAQMLNLMGDILANGSAGLIDLDLVKSQKLLGAGAFVYSLKDYSMLILQANPAQGQSLDDVKQLVLAELTKLKKGDFSDDLITSIINNAKKGQISRNDSYKTRADELVDAFVTGVDWTSQVSYLDNLSKITKKDIVDFANKYLNDQNYVAVYKRQGVDDNVVKVVKPAITPVSVNREDQSDFLKKVSMMPENAIQPVWLDYNKDVQKAKLFDTDVLAVQNKDNELFSLTYQYKIGKWNNKLLSLAAGYLEFLGTKDRSSEDFSKEFYKLASSFSVSSGNEETNISISGLNTNFDKTVSLIQDLVKNCVVDQAAFDSYIARLKKSRINAKENKGVIMEGLKSYAKYGAKNPFNYTFTDAELDAIKAEDLVRLLHDFANMRHTILYFGPKTSTALVAELKPLKVDRRAYTEVQEGTRFTELPIDRNQVLFANFNMKQAEVFWHRSSELYNSAVSPTVALFNNYFGGGMGSIVFQTIRESKALAYSTYAFYGQPYKKENHYMVGAYVGTQADKFNEAVTGMNELLNDLPESSKALEIAKVSLTKSLASDRITNSGILMSYLSAQRLGNTTDIRKSIYEKAPLLSYADLKAFHTKEMSHKPYVYCIVAQGDNIKDKDLQKLGEVKKLTLQEIFGY
ncbi:insulinase family protein [Sphingobacterium spiritivorum]|uniref:Peptidase M16 inactive domain protein n=1 Tax=Sphingobacterium spiritivorum ATCC 33861 TaxID=525373 RepID=D7VH32_SPHSI|nr:M16 family metallopeptidase [Sphingobacterium spiritivorum]EFK59384.1 peptidase M16 inactive domain protein [Sphingobacterium spiritivorum ATCC 33861]QQT33931.1 insulinase family protein [Sphingobacterium spiritivorum]WQD34752.1 insulinase family protein [Sphingobacterium spiritivorum]SUI98298.1 protease3 [Sphingobacterium spiritivorum]